MTKQAPFRTRWPGSALIGSVTVGCAVLGWLTLVAAARFGDAPKYATFAVLWALYYFLAGAMAGLQQEVTRAAVAQDVRDSDRGIPLVWLALGVGVGFAVVLTITYPLWGPAVGASWLTLIPMAVGSVSLAVFTATLGVLAAENGWRLAAVLLVGDAGLRLLAVGVVAATTSSAFWSSVAIVVGGLVWVPMLWSSTLRSTRNVFAEKWNVTEFLRRCGTVVVATASASLLITGLPWLMALSRRDHEGALASSLMAALILFRSPVLAVTQGLRPVILRGMLDVSRSPFRRFWVVVFTYLGGGALLIGAGYALGPWLLATTFGDYFVIAPAHAAVLLGSAVLLALATHLGLAFVADDRHRAGTAGWLAAVAVTLLVLVLPLGATDRLMVASIAGPISGLLVMGWAWAWAWVNASHAGPRDVYDC